ncbi:uncharacterized protein LOC127534344 [Acanthochromis polyacanthus]|uniref:uncharacterized protein LOC127534344 n=1 Tax=Acanthochromis polyacanthus TaxID=80966 RepID=UPI002234B8B9|nr:uncharacterized protein LOC127534344 [Acanthochromis polyacanthus]
MCSCMCSCSQVFICSGSCFSFSEFAPKKCNFLSAIEFVINIDTLMVMIPELLQVQRYVLTYRFSHDHLELLFNSIRASGGWNNNPSASQFQAIFRRLMVRCGVSPSETGNVAAQDQTVSLAAVEMSSPETAEEHPSPFANISAVVTDHSYLPTRFGELVENALVYIAGFVVRQILQKLSCDICHASLVRDAVLSSFDENYHLLTLKNRGGLVIPSQGTMKVLRAAERVIRQASTRQAPKLSTVTYIVREEVGTEDVFHLREHIEEQQFGIDNHHFTLLSLVVSVFLKIRLQHKAKLTSLELQKGSTRKKTPKLSSFKAFRA